MLALVILALSPVFAIGIYIYIKDKYEKEPVSMLLKSLLAGAFTTIAAIVSGFGLQSIIPEGPVLANILSEAFIMAAFNEELWKYLAFMLIIWRNRNFNENFDGIVYAVFISLGFAGVENILYVIDGGVGTGIIRAFTSVPGHALDGVLMGYFLSKAKFSPKNKIRNMIFALAVPVILHGIWNSLVFLIRDMDQLGWSVTLFVLLFIAFIIFLYILGFKKINQSVESSQFKPPDNNE